MTGRRIGALSALVAVLVAIYAYYAYEEAQFEESQLRKPLAAAEIDGLAAINVGQGGCGRPYELTRKGERLELRFRAERERDSTIQARFMAAQENYRGLDSDEKCTLLRKFSDLVQEWRD
ncbi:hypothetical protein Q9314_01080 [Shinella sumterensis]|nr:hypothetical protein Q9314_01080 [Shinella sumterensis]